ncbi:MAG: hypothetical protein Q4F17_02630 [Eubacteriales bacterium]|nr:hypothetical protein [Eubacteriales bacterium]
MLKPATEAEITQYMDFAYSLAMDPASSGYPAYFDGMKTKDDFISVAWRSLRGENREILLFIREGTVEGWIQFYVFPEDNYLQTEGFNIRSHTEEALEELIQYCKANYAGYELNFGFPADNQNAVSYLQKQGWPCTEQSWNQILHLKDYQLRPESPNVRKVTRETFDDFRTIHSQYDAEIYWNSQRIYDSFDKWHIYLYYKEEKPIGAIFYFDEEIFGLTFDGGIFDDGIYEALLTKAANDHKERGLAYLVFFQDEDSWSAAREMGFQRVGKYVLFVQK